MEHGTLKTSGFGERVSGPVRAEGKDDMARSMPSRWRWILVFCAATAVYLILDLSDMASTGRQIALFPIFLVVWFASSFMGYADVLPELDVDVPGVGATCIRVVFFGMELGVVLLASYFYRKTKRRLHFFLMLFAIGWIVFGFVYFIVMVFAITGMME
jgi:hypothetical protein